MAAKPKNNLLIFLQRAYVLRIIGLLIVIFFTLWQLSALNNANNALNRIDSVLYDWRFQSFTPTRELELPIVIIDIDEFTQIREGRWPWDRSKVAQLINKLHDYGTALMGFDMVFSEAVDNPVQNIIDNADLNAKLIEELQAQKDKFDGDLLLAQTLDGSVSLGFFLHNDGFNTGELPPPLAMLNPDEINQSTLIALPNYTANLPLFTNSNAHNGFVVAVPDIDGIIRRAPLIIRHKNNIYPSLSLEIARQALGAPWIKLQNAQIGGKQIITDIGLGNKLLIPLDAQGNILIPYKGPAKSFTTISATKILKNDLDINEQTALANSIALIGTSALGLRDLRSTPLQTNFPGVEVHANVLDTLLQAALGADTIYSRPDWLPGAVITFMLLLGVFLALFIPKKSPRATIITAFSSLILIIGLNLWLWQQQHMDLPLAAPVLMTATLTLANIIFAYFIANRQRQTIQNLFGEYVPVAHVDRMVNNSGIIGVEGESREMTVLFADIRNFTNISEKLDATELKLLLNNYLSDVTQVIFDHSGTIDKYVGDMVMAFWNAPLDDEQHAHNAVLTALDIQKQLVQIRAIQQNLPELHVGIGLNTGNMNVGDMGSKYRRAYTVIGDSVNLASRLESLTAYYKLPILVSEFTRQLAPDFAYRLVDLVQVKGRQQAVNIYQPMAKQPVDPKLSLYIKRFDAAVENYRNKNWGVARTEFTDLAKSQPEYKHLCDIYLDRMQIDPNQLPTDWSCVFVPDTK